MPVSVDARANHENVANKYFQAVDSFNMDEFVGLFTEDGTFTMGNNPTSVGHDQIRVLVSGVFSVLSAIKHDVVGTHSADESKFFLVQGL